MNLRRLKVILWKELLDLSRDKRTLLSTIAVPLIFLPLIGGVINLSSQTQPLKVILVDQDLTLESSDLLNFIVKFLEDYAKSRNVNVNITMIHGKIKDNILDVDLVLIVPRGFGKNVSDLDNQGSVILRLNPVSVRWAELSSYVNMAIEAYSKDIVKSRVSRLGEAAGVYIESERVIEPVMCTFEFQQLPGIPTEKPTYLFLTVMVLVIGLFLSMSPPVAFIADSVAGERERKTLEALLVSPIGRLEIVLGKLVSSLILGFVAGASSTIGVYLMCSIMFTGVSGQQVVIPVGFGLLGVFAVTVFLTVLVTLSISLLISTWADSVRAAQSNSYAIVSAASLIMFAALFVDIERIQEPYKSLLMLIPYTHSLLCISRYLKTGSLLEVVPYMIALASYAILFIVLTLLMFKSEKIVLTGRVKKRKLFKI